MKKLLFLFAVTLLVIATFAAFKYKLNNDLSQPVNTPGVMPVVSVTQISHSKPRAKIKTSLFIPNWTLTNEKIDTNGFDSFIYFGLKPDKQGISKTEQEVENIKKFNDSLSSDARKLLALRMTEAQENFDILSNQKLQRKIIDETIQTAQENNMQGIVLDLEVSAIPFDSLTRSINKFTSAFYGAAKKERLSFALALYGDTLYRARLYDLKTLAKNADTIMIMAYDLNKPNGNPGPNFPLGGEGRFGYDLDKMTDDFLQFVPAEKISVVFGLFGYDWLVDEKRKALGEGQALTFSQIKEKFVDKCAFANCTLRRDKDATESRISYQDQDSRRHVVWFEDKVSIRQKSEYLKSKGINSFSYWAYSYF